MTLKLIILVGLLLSFGTSYAQTTPGANLFSADLIYPVVSVFRNADYDISYSLKAERRLNDHFAVGLDYFMEKDGLHGKETFKSANDAAIKDRTVDTSFYGARIEYSFEGYSKSDFAVAFVTGYAHRKFYAQSTSGSETKNNDGLFAGLDLAYHWIVSENLILSPGIIYRHSNLDQDKNGQAGSVSYNFKNNFNDYGQLRLWLTLAI